MVWVVAYLASALAFLVIDGIWLGVVAKGFYARELGTLLRDSPDLRIAAVFYLVYAAGIVLFAVLPGLQAQSWKIALGYGVALGFIAYGTYDMTNLATLRGWPVAMSIADMAWGSVLTGVTALAGYWAARVVGTMW